MEQLVTTGRIIEIILFVMVLEALVLLFCRLQFKKGPAIAQTLANMGAGAMLMLAVWTALTDAPWEQTALFLAGSFGVHLIDLWLRFSSATVRQ